MIEGSDPSHHRHKPDWSGDDAPRGITSIPSHNDRVCRHALESGWSGWSVVPQPT